VYVLLLLAPVRTSTTGSTSAVPVALPAVPAPVALPVAGVLKLKLPKLKA
jgi:hypothetical protein